ncbi:MAG: hypothetical protein RLZZ598_1833 [Pseudomonadota bacterium]
MSLLALWGGMSSMMAREAAPTYAPHKILEGMKAVELALGPDGMDETFAVPVWSATKAAVAGCVDFDFGDAVPAPAHYEFANEMLEKGLFRLPFASVLFRSRRMGAAILAQQVSGGKYALMATSIGPVEARDGSFSASGPLLVAGVRVDETGALRIDWKAVTRGQQCSRKTGRLWTVDAYEDKADLVLHWVGGLTAMLMSRDVDIETRAASPRLNRDRVAKGREPIRETRVVKIRPHARAAQAAALADHIAGRASPVIHWRRGHFRQLAAPRRSDGATVIPIPPSIVGGHKSAAPPKAKDYALQLDEPHQ